MNYNRGHVRNYYASLTPDSRPCGIGFCPLMVVYPSMRRMADATRADPALVNALDRTYKSLYGPYVLPWNQFTAGQIVAVIDTVEAAA